MEVEERRLENGCEMEEGGPRAKGESEDCVTGTPRQVDRKMLAWRFRRSTHARTRTAEVTVISFLLVGSPLFVVFFHIYSKSLSFSPCCVSSVKLFQLSSFSPCLLASPIVFLLFPFLLFQFILLFPLSTCFPLPTITFTLLSPTLLPFSTSLPLFFLHASYLFLHSPSPSPSQIFSSSFFPLLFTSIFSFFTFSLILSTLPANPSSLILYRAYLS